MSGEVRLWREPVEGPPEFIPENPGEPVTERSYIALPAAEHAALMRVVEAARALLDLLAYEHPDFGYSEIADLRAALAAPEPAQAGEAVLPFAMFCYVCGEPAACIGYECGEEPGAHTLNGCCNDHCGHGNESERCVQLAPHPSRPGGAA